MDVYATLKEVRTQKPLVYHLTNLVTIYDCANITRTVGALPVMAHAPEEAVQMAGIASALVLNIGTLTKEFVDAMIIAGKAANKKGIPIVLDAVGAGATDFRTEQTRRLLNDICITILKGNAGEIATILGVESEVRGVESVSVSGEPKDIASKLASNMGLVVVITGKEDVVSDGDKTYIINNGHEMMSAVVGTGCMASSVIASFAAVEKDYAKAAASALSCFGIAGELAARESKGPASFKSAFYDALFSLNQKEISRFSRIE
jgi:hydroxyethylthiazole kinase